MTAFSQGSVMTQVLRLIAEAEKPLTLAALLSATDTDMESLVAVVSEAIAAGLISAHDRQDGSRTFAITEAGRARL